MSNTTSLLDRAIAVLVDKAHISNEDALQRLSEYTVDELLELVRNQKGNTDAMDTQEKVKEKRVRRLDEVLVLVKLEGSDALEEAELQPPDDLRDRQSLLAWADKELPLGKYLITKVIASFGVEEEQPPPVRKIVLTN